VIPSVSLESALHADPSVVAFLTSHRAVSVCTRELSRLGDALVAAATDYTRDRGVGAPTVRRAPDRCIVQLDGVALTATWLRNGTDSPFGGELLIMLWRGTIAPRGDHLPERLAARQAPVPPVEIWEASYIASAASESTWCWCAEHGAADRVDSPELAARCVARLIDALEATDIVPGSVAA
jgi:hypothetical protein